MRASPSSATDPALAAFPPAARAAWQHSFLESFPSAATVELASAARPEHLPAGTVLHCSGDGPFQALALVVDGLIRAYLRSSDGREVTVRYVGAGEVVGLATVISGAGDHGVQALADTAVVWLATYRLRALAARHAGVAWPLARYLAQQVLIGQELLAEDVFRSVRARVARHLLDLAAREGAQFVVDTSHRTLADAIGSVREVVARAVRALLDEGLIERAGTRIVLLDPAALHRAASGGGGRAGISAGR